MYQPAAFREERIEVLRDLIRAHPLATLITSGSEGLKANLVPFILSESGTALQAHISRANDQVEPLRNGADTLVVFQGPETYITPSWYASKQEHGRVVPTWNYVMVQVSGKPRLIEDAMWLRAQIETLTNRQESKREEPWHMNDAPAEFIEGQIKAIIGIEIPIDSIEGKWKVSQNRPEADRQTVAENLRKAGNKTMANLVERGQK